MTGPDRRPTITIALSLALALGGAACAGSESTDPGAGVPTGGFIVFEFDVGSWKEIEEGAGRVIFFGRPRDLMAAAKKH